MTLVTLSTVCSFSQQLTCPHMGPLRGFLSLLGTLQGSETETRELLGGTEESLSPTGVIDLPSRQTNDFLPMWPPK